MFVYPHVNLTVLTVFTAFGAKTAKVKVTEYNAATRHVLEHLYRDLEIPVKGQSSSLKVIPFNRLGVVSY